MEESNVARVVIRGFDGPSSSSLTEKCSALDLMSPIYSEYERLTLKDSTGENTFIDEIELLLSIDNIRFNVRLRKTFRYPSVGNWLAKVSDRLVWIEIEAAASQSRLYENFKEQQFNGDPLLFHLAIDELSDTLPSLTKTCDRWSEELWEINPGP